MRLAVRRRGKPSLLPYSALRPTSLPQPAAASVLSGGAVGGLEDQLAERLGISPDAADPTGEGAAGGAARCGAALLRPVAGAGAAAVPAGAPHSRRAHPPYRLPTLPPAPLWSPCMQPLRSRWPSCTTTWDSSSWSGGSTRRRWAWCAGAWGGCAGCVQGSVHRGSGSQPWHVLAAATGPLLTHSPAPILRCILFRSCARRRL